MTKTRRAVLKIYAVALAIGLAYALWLRLTGMGIPCVLNSATGLLCPGCGTTRMCLALLRLDIVTAFRYNGVVFCLFCYWNLTALFCLIGKPSFFQRPRFLFGSLWLSVGLLVLWGVLRNIL